MLFSLIMSRANLKLLYKYLNHIFYNNGMVGIIRKLYGKHNFNHIFNVYLITRSN